MNVKITRFLISLAFKIKIKSKKTRRIRKSLFSKQKVFIFDRLSWKWEWLNDELNFITMTHLWNSKKKLNWRKKEEHTKYEAGSYEKNLKLANFLEFDKNYVKREHDAWQRVNSVISSDDVSTSLDTEESEEWVDLNGFIHFKIHSLFSVFNFNCSQELNVNEHYYSKTLKRVGTWYW